MFHVNLHHNNVIQIGIMNNVKYHEPTMERNWQNLLIQMCHETFQVSFILRRIVLDQS